MNPAWNSEDLAARLECPGCGARPDGPLVAHRGDRLPLRACGGCGLLFVDPAPRPSALLSRYQNGYFSGASDFFNGQNYCEVRDRSIEAGNVTGYREVTANFELGGKSVLDIGCASGALLQSLGRHAPRRLVGIDIADEPLEFGRTRYGLDLRRAALEDAHFAPGEFDLILMVDVIEHVTALDAFLHEAARCLAPAGSIYVSTPDAGGLSAAGDRWCHLHINYEHLHYLSRESLGHLARSHGLEVVKSWSEGYPVAPMQYRLNALPRPLRLMLEPQVAIRNSLTRFRYRHAAERGQGCQLNAILRRVIH
ncbi:MAG TPA: class I SAM-dependent methyltransferase [Candidatus Binataceae bacterium]|nr:class I SAM-dependent methyltransferase [Candidatus Binataceae bacterium]